MQYACIDAHGGFSETTLGFGPEQSLFLEVSAGVWKCSRLLPGVDHALVSEVVIPGFDWADHDYLRPENLDVALLRHLAAKGWLES